MAQGGSGKQYFNPLPPCGGRRVCGLNLHGRADFNPLPPCGGRPRIHWILSPTSRDFNPLPPCGGRPGGVPEGLSAVEFQSTPSVWRETGINFDTKQLHAISIHSLRVEGDGDTIKQTGAVGHFNPLPPCGGRQQNCTAFRLKLSRANAILTKKNTDVLFHVRKNTFFLIFLRKNRCESLTLFLCAWGSHPSVFLEQKRFLHIDGFLCTDMFHFRLILIP